MSEIESWLERYEDNHRDLANPLVYWAAVPMIVLGTVGILWYLPVPFEFHEISPLLNWGSAFLMVAAVYYFIISLPIAIGLSTHDGKAQVFSNTDTGRISTWEVMEDVGVGTGALMSPEHTQEIVHIPSEEKDVSHIWLITATDEDGKISFSAGFAWEAAGEITSADQWNDYLDAHVRAPGSSGD